MSDTLQIQELFELAKKASVNLEQTQASAPLQLLADVTETRLSLSATGNYNALREFVRLVTRSERLFAVESIAVNSDENKPSGVISFKMQLLIWRNTDKKPTEAGTAQRSSN